MKKLLLGAVALFAVACAEKPIPKELDIQPENIEFWEVCDAYTINELNNFFYTEVDELVCEDLNCEDLYPFSSLLVAEYPFKDYEGKTQTCHVGGHVFAAAKKENIELINRYLELESVRRALYEILNGEGMIAWSYKNTMESSRGGVYLLYALQGNDGLFPAMDGSGIVAANAVAGQFGGYEVSITMDSKAAVEWANLTAKNVGKPLAIVMDNVVYSAPTVNGRIDGGKSTISGAFTKSEAEAFARALNQ